MAKIDRYSSISISFDIEHKTVAWGDENCRLCEGRGWHCTEYYFEALPSPRHAVFYTHCDCAAPLSEEDKDRLKERLSFLAFIDGALEVERFDT